MKNKTRTLATIVSLLCFRFLPETNAVNPPPDGGYPGFNTAEGTNALNNLSTCVGNAAIGWYSLFTNSLGSYNTGVGAGTLALYDGDENTAIGAGALLLNTTGDGNTANGFQALPANTTGNENTAVGSTALLNNTSMGNTGIGFAASGATPPVLATRRPEAAHSYSTLPATGIPLSVCGRSAPTAPATATRDWAPMRASVSTEAAMFVSVTALRVLAA